MYPRHHEPSGPGSDPEPVDPKLFRSLIDRSRQKAGRSVEPSPDVEPAAPRRGVLHPLSRPRMLGRQSKEQIVGRIRESFDDLQNVLAAIDRKIELHNQTSAKLETSVRSIPELIGTLPAASKAGAELLEDLRSTLGTQTSLTRDVVQSVEALALRVAQIPDALVRFDERLERQEEDQRRAVVALDALQTSIAEMQVEGARLQQQTFEQLAATLHADREETRRALDADRTVLAKVLERGNRQTTVLMVVLIAVVAVLAAALLLNR